MLRKLSVAVGLVSVLDPSTVPALANDTGAAVPSSTGAVSLVCSDTPTDAAMLNAGIAASSIGAEIVFSGPCRLDSTIVLLGDRAYRGESLGTTLRQADGANLVALLASDSFMNNSDYTGRPISVRWLTLDGNADGNVGAETSGIVLRSWLSTVERLRIQGMPGDGLRLTSASLDGSPLMNTQVNGRIVGNFITDSGRHGVHIEDAQNSVTDWTLTDNWIANSGDDGIHLDNAAGWMIARNHVYGVPHDAIEARRLFATTISDNYIEGFGEAREAGTWHGIYATVQGDASSTVRGNRVHNFGLRVAEGAGDVSYRYISLTTNYDLGVVAVTGNTVRGAGSVTETGLHYDAPPGTQLWVASSGNAVGSVGERRFVGEGATLSNGL